MSSAKTLDCDVLVIGGTAAGCAAAIAAARGGSKVVVLEPTTSLGGVTTSGVHCFDTGTLQALSGLAEEFVGKVLDHYRQLGVDDPMLKSKSDVFWEFHVAQKIWRDMIGEFSNIQFVGSAVPTGVTLDGRRIAAVAWEPAVDAFGNPADEPMPEPNRVRAKVVIDASYEGDVAAWAGAPFDIGREARSRGEPHAGVIHAATQERQVNAEGYLPATILPGSTGAGDGAVMAFTCRLSLRYRKEQFEQFKIAKPPNYDPSKYAWNPGPLSARGVPSFGHDLIPSVGGKMLLNQRYKGNDLLVGAREFILAHPRERTALRKRFFDHVLGFLFFIQNEGGMPQLGLAEDEYLDNDHIPHILYVREGRRFRSKDKMTEMDVNPYLAGPGPRPPRKADSIAIGDWAIESRRCSDELDPETNTYDGSMFMRALRAPYQVSFNCLVPDNVENLLVTTTISASHVAFCALRVEALWTATGTAAGLAANLAIHDAGRLTDIPVEKLQKQLIQQRCKLSYFSDVSTSDPSFEAIQWAALRGFVPEDGMYRFFPDHLVTWGDFVQAIVLVLDLPISVTGYHFEGLNPDHQAFRSAETLYDLASRAGVDLFPNMRHPLIDAPADLLRPELRSRWLTLEVDRAVSTQAAIGFLERLAAALDLSWTSDAALASESTALTRAGLASLLLDFAKASQNTNTTQESLAA